MGGPTLCLIVAPYSSPCLSMLLDSCSILIPVVSFRIIARSGPGGGVSYHTTSMHHLVRQIEFVLSSAEHKQNSNKKLKLRVFEIVTTRLATDILSSCTTSDVFQRWKWRSSE
jgi:hypothetical protein